MASEVRSDLRIEVRDLNYICCPVLLFKLISRESSLYFLVTSKVIAASKLPQISSGLVIFGFKPSQMSSLKEVRGKDI